MAKETNGTSPVETSVHFKSGSPETVRMSSISSSPGKQPAKGGLNFPILFERAGKWWPTPRFDSSILENEQWTSYFPQTRRRFQFALFYILAACVAWTVYFGTTKVYAHQWPYFLAGTLALLLLMVLVIGFTYTKFYEKFYLVASIFVSVLICVSVLLTLIYTESDLSTIGAFTATVEVLLMMYSVIPMPLYICVSISGIYSVLFEVLTALQNRFMQKPIFLIGKILLHICIHLMGIHFFTMRQVRGRSTFWKIGQSAIARKDLEVEKQIKEKMIHSLMPPKVAAEVMKSRADQEDEGNEIQAKKRNSKTKALRKGEIIFRTFNMNRMENVSILFADIVGFTKMSSNKTAEVLVGQLNDLFGRFDVLCQQSGCEKISTLGDCYYCVSGCPEPRPDHAKCCVEMGLGMIEAIIKFDEENNEEVNMRVGVHTGTVLCGIVGTRRFKFDVWSNDVILANTMESSGEPGRVHISDASYHFLKDLYEVEEGPDVEDNRSDKKIVEEYDKMTSQYAVKHAIWDKKVKTYFIVGLKQKPDSPEASTAPTPPTATTPEETPVKPESVAVSIDGEVVNQATESDTLMHDATADKENTEANGGPTTAMLVSSHLNNSLNDLDEDGKGTSGRTFPPIHTADLANGTAPTAHARPTKIPPHPLYIDKHINSHSSSPNTSPVGTIKRSRPNSSSSFNRRYSPNTSPVISKRLSSNSSPGLIKRYSPNASPLVNKHNSHTYTNPHMFDSHTPSPTSRKAHVSSSHSTPNPSPNDSPRIPTTNTSKNSTPSSTPRRKHSALKFRSSSDFLSQANSRPGKRSSSDRRPKPGLQSAPVTPPRFISPTASPVQLHSQLVRHMSVFSSLSALSVVRAPLGEPLPYISDENYELDMEPINKTWTKIRNVNYHTDLHIVKCIQEGLDSKEYFYKPPINQFWLTFKDDRLEEKYRDHYMEEQHNQHTISAPKYHSFLEIIMSSLVFLFISIVCFVIFGSQLVWLIVFSVALVIEILNLIRGMLTIKYAENKEGGGWLKMINITSGWYFRNFLGALVASLPVIAVFSNFSCNLMESSDWNDRLFCFCIVVSLLHYTNFTTLSSWLKTSLAFLAGVVLIVLIAVVKCPGDVTLINDANTTDNSIVTLGVTLVSVLPTVTLNGTQNNLGMDTNTTDKEYIPLFAGVHILQFEIILDMLLLALLIGILNRESEISYRLNYHGDAQAWDYKKKMQESKDQADWLLHNIIPEHVSEVVRKTTKYSKNHKDVGVIFAAIVNFNEIYDESFEGGREFLRVLNELVSDYEDLLDEERFKDVEKIKTISSTFMAASGLNEQARAKNKNPYTHLYALMEFSTELHKSIQRFNDSIFNFDFILNIGYNYGEVTAGVIGTTKLLYDIWGDTVNISSRMYSTGVAERTQVPEATANLLGDMMEFEYRGVISVKGKGEMKTFLFKNIKEGAMWD